MKRVKDLDKKYREEDAESCRYMIQPLSDEEIESAGALLYQRLAEINHGVGKVLYSATLPETLQFLRETSILLGAYVEGELVGILAAEEDAIERIAVDKEWIRLGIGSALISAAEEQGASYIDIYRDNEGAVKFIEALGYGIYDLTEPEAGDLLAEVPYAMMHFMK